MARQGEVWFHLKVENPIGRPDAGAFPVVQKDDGRSIGIGQGPVLVTPMQMVRAMAAMANGGRLLRTQLLQALGGAPAAHTEGHDLGWHKPHLERIRRGMRGVIEYGTGRKAGFHLLPRDVAVYGKTGTAQVGKDWKPFDDLRPGAEDMTWHHWFVGFAERPGTDPVAFACVLHARREAGAAATSAKVVADVLRRFYEQGGR